MWLRSRLGSGSFEPLVRSPARLAGRRMGARLSAGTPETPAPRDSEAGDEELTEGILVPVATGSPPTAAKKRFARDRAVPRYYVVWRLPGAAVDVTGIHYGDIRAWEAVISHAPGGRYRRGTDRLRRCRDLETAINLFYDEAAAHGCALPVRLFVWPSP